MAKRGTLDCPKNEMLAECLGTGKGMTYGLLETMWHRAAQYYQSGKITTAQLTAIWKSTGWLDHFEVNQLIQAMCNQDHQWLDKLSDDEFYIHDWHEHCDDMVHTALYRKIQTFANGTMPKARRISGQEKVMLDAQWEERLKFVRTAGRTAVQPDVQPSTCPVLPCLALPNQAKPSGSFGEVRTGAQLANEYWLFIPGNKKPLLDDLASQFEEKLRVYGDGVYDKILAKIKDTKRDRTQPIWEFWKYCDLDKQKPQSDPYYPTGEEIMARALKEQKERDDAKRAAQRCGIRADTGQPGDAEPGGVRGGVRDSLA